jgi:hypothetical protein
VAAVVHHCEVLDVGKSEHGAGMGQFLREALKGAGSSKQ